jgi:hypothetical protein
MAKSIPPITKKKKPMYSCIGLLMLSKKGDDTYEYAEIFFVNEEAGSRYGCQ